tara:strand:+ start:1311 stop:1580 length:270 start_codon:yes stop_codon:yes gene_type:complete
MGREAYNCLYGKGDCIFSDYQRVCLIRLNLVKPGIEKSNILPWLEESLTYVLLGFIAMRCQPFRPLLYKNNFILALKGRNIIGQGEVLY